MYLLECGFCFKHSLGHHIQVLDIVLILVSAMGHLDFFELLEWDGTGFWLFKMCLVIFEKKQQQSKW